MKPSFGQHVSGRAGASGRGRRRRRAEEPRRRHRRLSSSAAPATPRPRSREAIRPWSSAPGAGRGGGWGGGGAAGQRPRPGNECPTAQPPRPGASLLRGAAVTASRRPEGGCGAGAFLPGPGTAVTMVSVCRTGLVDAPWRSRHACQQTSSPPSPPIVPPTLRHTHLPRRASVSYLYNIGG